jgi:hypothetical protein
MLGPDISTASRSQIYVISSIEIRDHVTYSHKMAAKILIIIGWNVL